MKKFTNQQEAYLEDIEQILLETIADFLDNEEIVNKIEFANIYDPIERSKSELHIRMAKIAMTEFKNTMLSRLEKSN